MRHISEYFYEFPGTLQKHVLKVPGSEWRIALTDSEKRQNFVRLAEGRTQIALDAIRKLGNLSNSRAYEFTEADIRKIAKVLKDAVSDLEKRFGSSNESTEAFKL